MFLPIPKYKLVHTSTNLPARAADLQRKSSDCSSFNPNLAISTCLTSTYAPKLIRTSQGAQARSPDPSNGRSIARPIARSTVRSLARSPVRLVTCSDARSRGRSPPRTSAVRPARPFSDMFAPLRSARLPSPHSAPSLYTFSSFRSLHFTPPCTFLIRISQ